MRYPWIPLHETELDPWTLSGPEGPPRSLPEVTADLARAAAAGERMVVLWGHHPLAHPDLDELLATCRTLDLAPSVAAPGHELTPEDLQNHDLEVLWLPLHGCALGHDPHTAPGAFAATLDLLARTTIRVRILCRPTRDLRAAIEAVRDRAEMALLQGAHLPLEDRAPLLDVAWTTARGSKLQLELDDFHAPPDATRGDPRPLDDNLLRLRVQGGWLPGLLGGVTGAGDPHLLAALRMPRVDQHTTSPPPPAIRGSAAIIVPAFEDLVLATLTLPGLARELERAGVPTQLHSVWEPPWNLHVPDAFDAAAPRPIADPRPERATARQETAWRFSPAFLQHLDLSEAEHVIVPGYTAAATVFAHPTLRPDATLWILDLHLLAGVEPWLEQPLPERVHILSCFPGFAGGYLRRGLDLSHVHWLPYPLDRGTLRPSGDPRTADHWLCAGNHRRQHDLLLTAVDGLQIRPIEVLTAASFVASPPLLLRGQVELSELWHAVCSARAVVLPVVTSATDAAGITLAAMALHAGRPTVATRAWGMVDHLPQDAALLVPPDDPEALRQAITRLDADNTLLDHLARAAEREGLEHDTAAWARALTQASYRWHAT